MLTLLCSQAKAQTFVETALMFSRLQNAGTARILSMGGAQTALGADISTAASNPAGLGMYNRSEFSITGGQFSNTINGQYFSGDTQISSDNRANRTQFRIPNFGVVFSSPKNSSGMIKGNFGISQTRINDFNANTEFQARNPNTSIVDYFVQDANGLPPSQFLQNGASFNTPTQLAYDTYLIGEMSILDPRNNPAEYFTDVDGIPLQHERIETRGAQNQWNFSYGMNFNDKLFLGAGLGIASIRFQSVKEYRERFEGGPLDNLMLREDLTIRGSGLNLNLGAIYRIKDKVQIGMSYLTPTGYTLSDSYSARMETRWNNFEYLPGYFINNESERTDQLLSEYVLRTPGRLNVGATVFAGRKGFFTADIERVNLGATRYRAQTFDQRFDDDNQEIRELHAATTNVRMGGEFRHKKFRARAGYNFMPDPYRTVQNNVSRAVHTVSAGVGYRERKFFIDVAYIHAMSRMSYRPYLVDNLPAPLLTADQTITQILVTLGWPF
jgi:long-subunit fatty acid transport protein